MLSIGNKKYRNLQEQVGYNTECIKKLDEYLDGIDIDDKLVIIANDSGTLSAEELDVLSAPLAFISNGSRVWMKDSESASELVFKAIDIKAEEVGSAYFNIGGSKIVINRVTAYFEIVDDAIITTYSKDQLDTLLNGKANLSGATFSGPVVAPTFSQTQPNWSTTFTLPGASGLDIENVYNRFEVFGNVLYVVVNIKLTNNTASSISSYAIAGERNLTLPAEIASKIIDIDGDSVADSASSSYVLITADQAFVGTEDIDAFSSIGSQNLFIGLNNRSTANVINVSLVSSSPISIDAGKFRVITGRLALTLL